jgi:competence protein ComEC
VWLVPVGAVAVTVVTIATLAVATAWVLRRAWPLIIAAAVAWACAQLAVAAAERVAPSEIGRDVAVRGWIDGFPSHSDGQVTFPLQTVRDAESPALPSRLRLTWYDPPLEVRAAMALDLEVRLKAPRGLANPAGFDYERWLFAERYGATGYVRSGTPVTTLERSLPRRWLDFRATLAERIAALATSSDARALVIALAIGDRSRLERGHWRVLRETGTNHLVAISGLHVGIVATWLFVLMRWLWLRGPMALAVYDIEAASVVSLAGAALYAAIAGFSVPTQRALIMLAVALALVVNRRSAVMVSGIAIALVIVMILDPLAILSSGFWMSFGAVAVLSTLARRPRMQRSRAAAITLRVREAVRAQWGITIGLAPIIAVAFGELSLAAPLVNLIAIPVFALFLVPLMLVATICLAIGLPADWLVMLASVCADWVFLGMKWSVAAGLGTVTVPGFTVVPAVLLLAGVAIALSAQPLPGRFLGGVAIVSALTYPPARPPPATLRATVLDVGHGLAVIVQTADHVLLYDTGARYRSGFDMGRDVVLPAMRRLGLSHLDRIIVSHADNDHAGGLDAVSTAYPDTPILAARDVEVTRADRCFAGQRWHWDRVQFEVLHPALDADLDGNDGSCVLRITTADNALLLTGDIEARAERALLRSQTEFAADVVVVPHHGSATSSSDAFVDRTNASLAVVSAAFENRWGFPRPDVVERWDRSGAEMLVTGDVGAIDIVLGDTRVDVRATRWRWQRPWMADVPARRITPR